MIPSLSQSPSDNAFIQNPYPFYEEMRGAASASPAKAVFWQDYDLMCFCHFREVNAILRDPRFGRQILHKATREELGWPDIAEALRPFYAFEEHSLLELEPPDHTRIRKLVNRAFVGRAIRDIRPTIRVIAEEALDAALVAANSGPIDLIKHFCEPIPVRLIARLLGVPEVDAPQLLNWSHDMVAMYQHGKDAATEIRAVEATCAFSDYIGSIIAAHRQAPKDDLLSSLIRAQDDGDQLSEDELVTTAILLLNAGHEATVHGLGNGIKLILEQKLTGQALFSDPAIAAKTTEEILRFDPPLHLFTRYALEDLEWNGVPLKKGQSVGLLLGAANRDSEEFENADQFTPYRDIKMQLALGAGIHFCVGAPLARAEMQESLTVLFARCPQMKLAASPIYADRYHFHGLEALRVVIGNSI